LKPQAKLIEQESGLPYYAARIFVIPQADELGVPPRDSLNQVQAS
jgi:hypothetical protein